MKKYLGILTVLFIVLNFGFLTSMNRVETRSSKRVVYPGEKIVGCFYSGHPEIGLPGAISRGTHSCREKEGVFRPVALRPIISLKGIEKIELIKKLVVEEERLNKKIGRVSDYELYYREDCVVVEYLGRDEHSMTVNVAFRGYTVEVSTFLAENPDALGVADTFIHGNKRQHGDYSTENPRMYATLGGKDTDIHNLKVPFDFYVSIPDSSEAKKRKLHLCFTPAPNGGIYVSRKEFISYKY